MKRDLIREFADVHGELNPPQPGRSPVVHQVNYMFRANMSKLQKVCDEWLNRPCGYKLRFEPILPFVVIGFSNTYKGYSIPRFNAGFGATTYRENVIMLFVKLKNGWCRQDKMYMFLPYIFLDSAGPLAAGRETFGLPKILADVTFDERSGEACLRTAAPGSARRPAHQVVQRQILRVDNLNKKDRSYRSLAIESDIDMLQNVRQMEQNFRKKTKEFGSFNSREVINLFMRFMKMDFVTLRQVRDYQHPEKASYKCIMEYTASKLAFLGRPRILFDDFEVSYPEFSEKYPLQKQFGIRGRALATYYMEWGYNFTPGDILWEAK